MEVSRRRIVRRISFLVPIVGIISLLVSCSSSPQGTLIQPTEGNLTFVFFYTDGWQPWAEMQPIVDGLETEYSGLVEFTQINASTPEGLEIFNSYRLFGHPSYLILDDTGKVLWQSVGEQPVDNIESALDAALEN